jgi:hypothetical protein
MAIPHVYSTVYPQDFTLSPVKVHKKFVWQRSQFYSGSIPQTGSGYRILDAVFTNEKLKLGTDSQTLYQTNSFDGSYKAVVWKSIDSQYYRYPYDTFKTLEHSNKRFTYKFLNYSASLISIPYLDYGESIKPGSVEITASGYYLTDDGNGNIYDISLNTGSYSDNYNLVAYWGFNDCFRKAKSIAEAVFDKTNIPYKSNTFSPDEPSVARDLHLRSGVNFNNTASGLCAYFDGEGSIVTHNRDDFNFTKDDDFTISFWLKYEPHGTDNATVISKNSIIRKQVYGLLDKYNQNDLVQQQYHVSSSIVAETTPVYPYRFEIVGLTGLMVFKRSDGIKTTSLSGSIDLDDSRWHHYAAVKSGSMLTLYQDGVAIQSGSEVNEHPINKHSLMFASDDFNQTTAFFGYLDEMRIYNKGLSSNTIATLADSSSMGMYQTAVVGNVFYKTGNIVLTSPVSTYNNLLNSDWTLKFRSTHVIYSYECLVRIPAGSFNLSQNPTTLKNPNTDLIIDEMTGSLAEGALFPYATAIGLYNEKRELVAVAKLSQPLQMRDDVNLNISVKWDS